jgi:hypothetical protein
MKVQIVGKDLVTNYDSNRCMIIYYQFLSKMYYGLKIK